MTDTIGGLLNIGFEGTALPREIKALIRGARLGGITLFSRNFQSRRQLMELTQSIRRAAGRRHIMICIDQEGGRVQRLRDGFTLIPAARALGEKVVAAGHEKPLIAIAKQTGRELKEVGINTNFAPVLDVDTQPANPIIGDRSFGTDPALVARCGVAVIKGLRSAGILACGKHFPGHGDTTLDSHLTLPHVTTPRDLLWRRELVPFVAAVRAGLKLVMTAHVVYDRVDPRHPATLSPFIIRWLRDRLRFTGLILTDDLNMKGISQRWSLVPAIESGLMAGIDQFLICRPQAGEIEQVIIDLEKKGARSPRLRKAMRQAAQRASRLRP